MRSEPGSVGVSTVAGARRKTRDAKRAALYAFRLAFFVLLVAAAALRFTDLNWDQFQHVHPDERFIVWVADSISRPASLRTAFDPALSTIDPFRWPPDAGDLAGRPRDYAYGHLPLYLLVLVSHAAAALGELAAPALPAALAPAAAFAGHLASYDYLPLTGRALSGLSDLGVLCLVYLAGRRAYGRAAGLLAAAAYAFAVLPIQLSHYYGVDMVLTLCILASLTLAARYAERGGRATWLGAGALAGLAVGSKFSAVLLVIPLLVAAAYRPEAFLPDDGPGRVGFWRRVNWGSLARRLAVAGGAAVLAFVITNPFAVIEFPAYLSNILAQNAMVSGTMDAPYTRQFIGSLPYWYFVQQLGQWGLGWPLGIVAWGGFAWAVLRLLCARVGPAEAVLLAWAVPYFATTGAFLAKFPRYLAPLLPCLLVFGAGAALAVCRWLEVRWGRRGRLAGTLALSAVGLFTVAWALAFSGVYAQEHPWLQASEWLYAHVPDGSTLLSEAWDDSLPLAMDEVRGGPAPQQYQRVELPLYDPDTPDKADLLAGDLSRADYLVVASNRLWRPIGRLTGRYPMSSQYYRLLRDGELGYVRVAEFAVYPRLGSLTIPDDNADESFTVYDHPHVFIYANAARLDEGVLRLRLGQYLPRVNGRQPSLSGPVSLLSDGPAAARAPTAAVSFPAGQAAQAAVPQAAAPRPPAMLAQPVDTLPIVADFRWNKFASQWPPSAVLFWWLVLGLFGWLAWPLLYPLLPGLRDRGFGLARIAGWLTVGWVNWLGASLGLWENRAVWIAALLGALAVAGLLAYRRQRVRIAAFWARHRRLLLIEEGLFALAFLAFVGIRLLDPDLWQPWNGGEKFMEFSFLNAILRSAHFPPYDPYFAGGTINYYYYGLYLVSLLIKLTGIVPEVAFNLAVPSLFALTAGAIFSIAYSLVAGRRDRFSAGRSPRSPAGRPLAAASLSVFLALLMGNLQGFWQVVQNLADLGGAAPGGGAGAFVRALLLGIGHAIQGMPLPGYDYWGPSRVIPFTINEFPYWTFLFADMHPHLIAMPLGMLVVGLALGWLMPPEAGPDPPAAEEVLVGRVDNAGNRPHADGAAAGQALPAHAGPAGATARERSLAAELGLLLLLALALGALGPTNTWDLPVYTVLVAGTLWLAAWRRRSALASLEGLLVAGGVIALAVLAYWPFYAHYNIEIGAGSGPLLARFFAAVHASSPPADWLLVWGFFLFMAYSLALWRCLASSRSAAPAILSLLVALLAGLGLVALGRPTAALAVVPAVLALVAFFRRRIGAADAFANLLLLAGLGLLVGSELLYLRDFLEGGDWYRMNTVFKFSMPAWLFLAIAAGAGLPHLWRGLGHPAAHSEAAADAFPAAAASSPSAERPGAPAARATEPALEAAPLPAEEPGSWRHGAEPADEPGSWPHAAGPRDEAGSRPLVSEPSAETGLPLAPWPGLPPAGPAAVYPAPPWAPPAAGRRAAARWAGRGWRAVAGALLFAGLFFPAFGTPARVTDRFPSARPPIGTLDASAYMATGRYQWPDDRHTIDLYYDYQAIHWLLDHVQGTPVVAEAPAGSYDVAGRSVAYDYYRAGGLRVASLTGLPTFVGQHEYEQRPGAQVGEQAALGQEFFATPDLGRARALIGQLHVDYIYVGQLERILFGEAGLSKFDALVASGDLEVAYRNPQVVIYRVKRAAG